MRGDTDPPLGRRQAEGAAHRARQPGVARRVTRPGPLVESAEDDEIGLLQPCLEQAPDGEPGMPAVVWTYHRPSDQRLEERGIVNAAQRRKIA
jgi:hypothetical protein